MSEEKRKPFNADEYTGQAVETRSGQKVVELYIFGSSRDDVMNCVCFRLDGWNCIVTSNRFGQYDFDAGEHEHDLFFSPTKKTAYLVVHKGVTVLGAYGNESDAKEMCQHYFGARMHAVEFEVDE
jgi:hypothetical protein